MNKKKDLRWIKYAVSVAVGLALSFGIAVWRGLFTPTVAADVLSAIVDGMFVVGIITVGVGLLILVANTGTLDILGFGFKSVWYLFTPFGNIKEKQDYYDYKVQKQEERKKKKPPLFLVWVGCGFVLVSLILLIPYYLI